jgi:signal transduction histidine kinase
MNIRNRLTLKFIIIVAVILALGSLLIYVFSADYRQDDFYSRLQNKAQNTAKLLIDVDEVDANLLQKLETDNPISLPDEKIVIFSYKNEKIFTTDKKSEIIITNELLDAIRLEDEVKFKQGQYEVLGFLFKSRYDRFTVVAAAKDVNGFNKLKNLRTVLISVFVFSIIVVSGAGWIFSGNALRPISRVIDQVDEITVARLDLRVDEGNGQDEIAKLAKTFNNMLSRIEGSFRTQRNFIANASHELRTPLTSITGQLEVAMLNTRSIEDYRNVINSVLEDIKNLTLLSNRLLLLAQSTTTERQSKMGLLRVDELLWQVRDQLLAVKPAYLIRIDIDQRLDDHSKLSIRGDEQLLKSAFFNIIENGCKYSPDQAIDIQLKLYNNGIMVRFQDKGIGIATQDLPNIFEPFYRGHNTKTISGHGIGLSIVKPILDLHRADFQVTSTLGTGTIFTVAFPAPEF